MNEKQMLKEIAFNLANLLKKEEDSLEKTITNATKIFEWFIKE